jgi:hypothetical protein
LFLKKRAAKLHNLFVTAKFFLIFSEKNLIILSTSQSGYALSKNGLQNYITFFQLPNFFSKLIEKFVFSSVSQDYAFSKNGLQM